jgi:hypothetical protein
MRRGLTILTIVVAGLLVLGCTPVIAQHSTRAELDVDVFYDGLEPYGDWVEMAEYGWSWAPRVERGWRPYTRGQWVLTDDGWYWDSDEAFGWAAYHYGRWVDDSYYGWVWVPGNEWAPAWVSWRHGNGYTGWAPLPPRATWRSRVGLSIGGIDIDAFIGADDYVFVQDRAFVNRGIYQSALPWERNRGIIGMTDNVTNYDYANERVVNRGIAVATVERSVGRRVPRLRTIDRERADPSRRAIAGEVSVFRPEVRGAPGKRPKNGRSLARGEQPPVMLEERRNERAAEQRRKISAKDAVQQPAAPSRGGRPTGGLQVAPHADAPTKRAPEAIQPRSRGGQQQDDDRKRAEAQERQRLEQEKTRTRAPQRGGRSNQQPIKHDSEESRNPRGVSDVQSEAFPKTPPVSSHSGEMQAPRSQGKARTDQPVRQQHEEGAANGQQRARERGDSQATKRDGNPPDQPGKEANAAQQEKPRARGNGMGNPERAPAAQEHKEKKGKKD